jgi:uncharacterized protein (TIGR02117 family)
LRVLARVAKFLLLAIAAFAVAVFVGAFVPRPLFSLTNSDIKDVTIYLAASAIHTDIIIPADQQSRAEFAFLGDGLQLANPEVKWLMFGWGGRSFYIETPTWSDLKAVPVFRALTLDAVVMHVETLGDINVDSPVLKKVVISRRALAALKRDIAASFSVEADGNAQLITGSAYGAYDQFYEANGRFNALLGCNTWTARILRTAGVRTGIWNPFPQTLRISLNLYN